MVDKVSRTTVDDFVTLVRGTTYKGSLVGSPGPALLGLGSIEPGGGFRHGRFKTYGGDCPSELMLYPGDMYASLKGATKDGKMIGSVARVPLTVTSGRLTQDTVKLVFRNPNVEDASYLYWVLRTPQYRDYCDGHAMGSAVVALSRRDFLSYPVPFPTVERRLTVSILDAIEEKIELNRRMNETLEGIAQALFKAWFVDFEPVRAKAEGRAAGLSKELADLFPDSFEDSELGEMPKGWSPATLGTVLKQRVKRCVPSEETASLPYVPIDCISSKSLYLSECKPGAEAQSSLARFYKGDLLFGAMRPYFHKVCIAPFDGTTRTTAFVLTPIIEHDFSFATMLLHHPDTIDFATRHSTGSTIPYAVWTSSLENMPIMMPPAPIREAFNSITKPLLDRIPPVFFESRWLTDLRDSLLPRLLSGEMPISDVERIVGEDA